MLRVVVLGAAAGGGVPQWNCGCPVCRKARTENPELQSTQASIAVSADGEHWFLVNASPDLRQQLIATPQLHPESGPASPQPDLGRHPDQWRNRCGRGPAVDARRLAVHDLRAPKGACDPEGQQHLQCAEREERAAPGQSRWTRRSSRLCPTARRPASRSCRSRFPAKARGIWKARLTPAATDGAGDTLGLRIGDKASGQVFLFSRRLRRRHRRSQVPACRRAADLLRRHGVARRRVDRGGPRQQDRARHGTYRDVGRSRRDRKPRRPRYRPEDISAYQQFQSGAAARLRGAQDGRAGGLANSRRWNGDHALNAETLNAMTPGRDDGLFARQGAPLNSAGELEAALRHIGATRYHNLHPFHRLLARRQAEQGTGAGLGAEPLFLPEHDSAQGRGGDLALPRPRHPAGMAAPDRGP